MYTARGLEYDDFMDKYRSFKDINYSDYLFQPVKNRSIENNLDSVKLSEINKLFGSLWSTLEFMVEIFIKNPNIYPISYAKEFTNRFASFVDTIYDFWNGKEVYNDFMNHTSDPEESEFLKSFDHVYNSWISIASTSTAILVKNNIEEFNPNKVMDQVIEDIKIGSDIIKNMESKGEGVIEQIQSEYDKKLKVIETEIRDTKEEIHNFNEKDKKEITELVKKAELSFSNSLSQINSSLEEKKLHVLIDMIKRKKSWVLGCMIVLGVALIAILTYSLCTADSVMQEAAKDKYIISNLSYIYILKHSIPYASAVIIMSIFIFALFRLLKSYLHLIETYEFKKDLIANMRKMMEDPFFKEYERAQIISKLIETLTHFNSSGLLDIKHEKNEEIMSMLISALTRSKE